MKRYWDKFTDSLGKTIFHPQYFLKSLEYEAISTAKKYAQDSILVDIGCGRQPYKKDLLPLVKKYIGVDHPQTSKKYGGENKPDILADATKIPLPNNYANLTMMISVLEHLPDPTLALKEARRITRKGGYFIGLTVQNYRLHDMPHDYFRYTRFGLKELLTRSGFKIIKITPLGNYPVLISQYFNVFILYKTKALINNKAAFLPIAVLLLPLVFIACFLSNAIALLLSNISDKDGSGSFAIYNLAIAKKVKKKVLLPQLMVL